MKIRQDFVTNSSSSSYICVRVPKNLEDDILLQNDTGLEDVLNTVYETGEAPELKGDLDILTNYGCIVYIGKRLFEKDFEHTTLHDIKKKLADDLNREYGWKLKAKDIIFEYGEIYS